MRLNSVLILVLFFVLGCNVNPLVEVQTSEGEIIIEVYQDRAPVTGANFLRYVDERRYDGAMFYRVVDMENQPLDTIKIEVIQGGLYEDPHSLELNSIVHETTKQTGLLHKDGTISMARLEPGSASSEFFICIGDQPDLDFGGMRNVDGQGFAAFGRVIKGMGVVRKIQSLNNTDQLLDEKVLIKSIRRI